MISKESSLELLQYFNKLGMEQVEVKSYNIYSIGDATKIKGFSKRYNKWFIIGFLSSRFNKNLSKESILKRIEEVLENDKS